MPRATIKPSVVRRVARKAVKNSQQMDPPSEAKSLATGLLDSHRFLLILLVSFVGSEVASAQHDIYLVDTGKKLFRWKSLEGTPLRLPSLSGFSSASMAINRRNEAYVNTGLDGRIHSTDGRTTRRVYQRNGQIRELAFGRSNDVLFFSVVPTPQNTSVLSDGQIYALNLKTGRAQLRHTIAQRKVDNAWWGTFTADLHDRLFLGTYSGGIYELKGDGPELIFRSAGNKITGLTLAPNDFYYTTGGPQVYRLKNRQNRELALTVPRGQLQHISYAPFPLSTENNGGPCELHVNLTGDNPRLVSLFSPVLRGPNLYWLSPNTQGSGRRTGQGTFRYFLRKGTYWVSMDSKADTTASPRPAVRRVDCTRARADVSFRL